MALRLYSEALTDLFLAILADDLLPGRQSLCSGMAYQIRAEDVKKILITRDPIIVCTCCISSLFMGHIYVNSIVIYTPMYYVLA